LPWRGEIDELRVGSPITGRREHPCFNHPPSFSAMDRSTSRRLQEKAAPAAISIRSTAMRGWIAPAR
jgi:hypothetical protein